MLKVETKDGNKQVLRIHRAAYHTDDALRSELQWIQALASDGIETPDVIPTLSGELFITPDSTLAGLPRQIDVFAWVNGEPLGNVEEDLGGEVEIHQSRFKTIGELAAKVHNQSSGWEIPSGFVRHSWDVEGLTGDKPFWGGFWELDALSDSERDLIEKTRDRVREDKVID